MIGLAGVLFMHRSAPVVTFGDEWSFFLDRRGMSADSLLMPHNQHFVLVPVLIYKLMLNVAGLDHYWVFRAVILALHVCVALVVFALARRRFGGWAAVACTAPVLFFGAGYENIIYPFQIQFVVPVAAGIGAFMLLETGRRRADVWACAALVLVTVSSSVGLVFVVGAAVWLALRRRDWRRWWIVGVPVVVYGLWRLNYHPDQSLDLGRIDQVPSLLVRYAVASCEGLFAVGAPFGAVIAALVTIVVGVRLAHDRRDARTLIGVIATAGAWWTLIALSRADIPVDQSRYVYVGGVLIAAMLIEALPRPAGELQVRALVPAALLAVAISVAGLPALRDGSARFAETSARLRAQLGALVAARTAIDPRFLVHTSVSADNVLGAYLAVVDSYGSPALTVSGIQHEPDPVRAIADRQLIAGERLIPYAVSSTGAARGCEDVPAGAATPAIRAAPPGFVIQAGRAPAEVRLLRLGVDPGLAAPTNVPARKAIGVSIPADGIATPWRVAIRSEAVTRICLGRRSVRGTSTLALPPGIQTAVTGAVDTIASFCATPGAPENPAVTAAVDTLIGVLEGGPDRVYQGPPYADLSVRQILANVGGLLNKDGCAPDLGSRIGSALEHS